MISKFITVVLGFFFALGLGISQMTRPQKILGFLDVLGDWDPSLLLVMVAAIGVYYPLQRYVLKRPAPKYEEKFTLPKLKELDSTLIVGSAIFGIGWGMVGLCPGPSITALASGMPKIVVFLVGMSIGMLGYMWFQNRGKSGAEKLKSHAESEETRR